jgi:hypothetical protein
MELKHKILLFVDGIINVTLGVILLLFPLGIADFLGLPITSTKFYPSILGAVLFGIGIALFIEILGFSRKVRGLGIGGAIAINMIGALVLVFWLLFGSLSIPIRGQIVLWAVGIVVLVIALFELFTKSWQYNS